ncbi:dienelactone hydrolase family-domain-containing protein [Haematococcus lacustris]
MGGALSFAAAQKVPLIVAAAPNYGTPNPQQFQVEEIKIPILATFGGKDMVMGFSDPATAATVAQKIRAAGGNIDLRIFPSAAHGFLNQVVGEAGVAMIPGLIALAGNCYRS